jgi:ribosomal protein S18 acetylase RimI-like enzyme
MNIEIRRAAKEDVAKLVELHREVHELHLALRPDQFKQIVDDDMAAVFLAQLAASATKVWVAELDGTVAGYVVAMRNDGAQNTMCPRRARWEIDQIGVATAHRRLGIARALVSTVVDAALADGTPAVELNCWAFNRDAHAAFQSFGFVPKIIRFELKR